MAKPPISPLSRFGVFFLLGATALLLGLLAWLDHLPAPVKHPAARSAAKASTPGSASTPAETAGATANPAAADLQGVIARALGVLNDPANPDKASALLALRDALKKADPAVGIAVVRDFLKSGKDGATGEAFKVGPGGLLAGAPTMRTLLMDQLGSWSNQTGGAEAAETARGILQTKGSPDEWAVSLRNLGWNDPQGSKATLAAKARELITYKPWQQSPTAGYMEAFDAAAYSGDPTLVEILAPMGKDKTALQQPALVAIDRLSAMAPREVADYLNAHPAILADRPLMRADYMGKMNLSDSAQRNEAETYLRRTDVSQAEKTKFLQRLGVPAGFVSDNLLTPPNPPAMPLIERRALVNATAADWLQSGQYPALEGALQTLIEDTRPPGGS